MTSGPWTSPIPLAPPVPTWKVFDRAGVTEPTPPLMVVDVPASVPWTSKDSPATVGPSRVSVVAFPSKLTAPAAIPPTTEGDSMSPAVTTTGPASVSAAASRVSAVEPPTAATSTP